jgi:hypothetical protein
MPREVFLVDLVPALRQPAGHAHRHQHLRIAAARGGEVAAARCQAQCRFGRLPGHVLSDERQAHQDQGAGERRHADQHMEGEADRQIQRQPRQIEECARPLAAEKGPDIVEIAQRLQPFAAANDQWQPHDGVEHARIQALVQRGADPAQDAAADQVERALRGIEAARQDDQADQGGHAAAWQHAVVHLQHEDRAGEIKQVDDAAHHADAEEGTAAAAQCVTQL